MQSLPFLRRLLLPLPRQLPRPASSLPSPVQSSAQKVPTPRSSLPPPLFPELRVFSDAVALALRWTYLCIRRCPAPRQAPGQGGRGRCLRGCTWRDPGFLRRRAGNGAPQAGALLRGVLSSGSSPRSQSPLLGRGRRKGRSGAGRVEITCGFSPSPASVRPIPGGALGLATPQIPSALRLGALSCLTPGTPKTSHWLQAAPQASVYKGGG